VTISASPSPTGAEPSVTGRALGVVQPISVASRRRRTRSLAADAPFDEVLTSAKAGFPSAFELLFRQLGRPLAAYFRTQGAADPAGSVNDVLLRVFRGLDRFEGDEPGFRAWVFTIARNSLVDERRKARRRVSILPMEPAEDLLPEEPGSEEGALARLGTRDAVEVIQGLVPDQREVLLLRILADLTVEQVAAVTGKRPGAVKALQRRGLAAIRRKVAGGEVWGVPR
jgi:RNA polymerase sigma-70 factor (ECF subfamily)